MTRHIAYKRNALVALAVVCLPGPLAAQLPFDITQDDVLAVDTTRVEWTGIRSWVGGVEGELRYGAPAVTEGQCKAVAVLGLVQLRDHYLRQRREVPVSIRLGVRCGTAYRGHLVYDGVVVRLELYDLNTGALAYRGRWRGLP